MEYDVIDHRGQPVKVLCLAGEEMADADGRYALSEAQANTLARQHNMTVTPVAGAEKKGKGK